MSTFYASADGVVFHPVSNEARRCAHDSTQARDRLAKKFASRKQKQALERKVANGNDTTDVSQNSPVEGVPLSSDHDLTSRRLHDQQLRQKHHKTAVEQRKHDRGLAQDTRFYKGTTKAIPSNYVYKPGAAENKHARAIVHHTGRYILLYSLCFATYRVWVLY